MSEAKLYDNERDIMEMDKAGNYYCRHVSAMTREALHSKCGIAAELGWRDMQIDKLKADAACYNWIKENCSQVVSNEFDYIDVDNVPGMLL